MKRAALLILAMMVGGASQQKAPVSMAVLPVKLLTGAKGAVDARLFDEALLAAVQNVGRFRVIGRSDMERLLERALDTEENERASPKQKAAAWCELAKIENSAYTEKAGKACSEWTAYLDAQGQRAHADLRRGDQILKIEGRAVSSTDQVTTILEKNKRQVVKVTVFRHRARHSLWLESP